MSVAYLKAIGVFGVLSMFIAAHGADARCIGCGRAGTVGVGSIGTTPGTGATIQPQLSLPGGPVLVVPKQYKITPQTQPAKRAAPARRAASPSQPKRASGQCYDPYRKIYAACP